MNTMRAFRLAALCLVLLLCACAEKAPTPPPPPPAPEVQAPPPLAPQDWRHPVFYYATNRNLDGIQSDGAHYGGGRWRETSYGQLLTSASAGASDGTDLYRVNVGLDRVTRMTSTRFYSDVERAAARMPGREALVFIHGFDNGFTDAALTTARIAAGVGFEGAVILYSWPSAGNPAAYMADRNNAYWSVQALKDFLTGLTADPWIGRVSIVVHSMGNEAFIRAYGDLAAQCHARRGGCGDLAKIRTIVLAAPDMDRDIFIDQYAAKITSLGARVVLYASTEDMALAASALVQGGDYERLGKNVVCIPGIHVTDVSAVKTDPLGHSWIAQSRAVLTDLRCSLIEGCNRYSTGLLQEYVCPDSRRAHPAGMSPAPDNRALSGASYWKLTAPRSDVGKTVNSGFPFKVPFLSN
jgi:esterase/lipase superfamily enzyme